MPNESRRARPSRRHVMTIAAGAFAAGLAPAISRAQQRTSIKLTISSAPPDPAAHFYYYAQENGFYRQEGLDVELTPIPVETNALRAIAAGEAQGGNPGSVSTLRAMRAGGRVRIGAAFAGVDYLIVAKSDVADVKGLEGRTMAISGLNAATHTFALVMLQRRSVDVSRINWVAAGSSAARLTALLAGRVDAAILSSTFAATAMQRGSAYKSVADSVDDMPAYPWIVDILSQEFLRAQPQASQGLFTALSRAVRWMRANPDDALAISRRLLPDMPADALGVTVRRLIDRRIISDTGVVTPEAFDGLVQWLVSTNQLDQPVRFADAVEPQLIQGALATLGPVAR
jgi:NitT/TauT family transport system substrate-binding protein